MHLKFRKTLGILVLQDICLIRNQRVRHVHTHRENVWSLRASWKCFRAITKDWHKKFRLKHILANCVNKIPVLIGSWDIRSMHWHAIALEGQVGHREVYRNDWRDVNQVWKEINHRNLVFIKVERAHYLTASKWLIYRWLNQVKLNSGHFYAAWEGYFLTWYFLWKRLRFLAMINHFHFIELLEALLSSHLGRKTSHSWAVTLLAERFLILSYWFLWPWVCNISRGISTGGAWTIFFGRFKRRKLELLDLHEVVSCYHNSTFACELRILLIQES